MLLHQDHMILTNVQYVSQIYLAILLCIIYIYMHVAMQSKEKFAENTQER